MYFVYALRSRVDHHFYVGFTRQLEIRIQQHNSGRVESTKRRSPLDLVYYEASLNLQDALHREKYFKTTYGKRYLKNRIRHYLDSQGT